MFLLSPPRRISAGILVRSSKGKFFQFRAVQGVKGKLERGEARGGRVGWS